jgi:Na+/H+ antiporter NhaC
MRIRIRLALAALLVFGLVLLAFGQPSKVPHESKTVQQATNGGRFSMVAAEVHEGIGGPRERTATVFVIDTQTGRVWRWAPDTEVNHKLQQSGFYGEPFVKYGESPTIRTEYPQ